MRIKHTLWNIRNSDQGLHLLNLRFLLKDMDVLVPPRNVQNQFADFVASVDKSK